MEEEVNWITYCLSQEELLAQTAEEAIELGKACLKLRRAMGSVNPTPISVGHARENLNEEIADVMLCLEQLVGLDMAYIDKMKEYKRQRWIKRLKNRTR